MSCVGEIDYSSTEQAAIGRTFLQYNSNEIPACSVIIGMYPLGGCGDAGARPLMSVSDLVSIETEATLTLGPDSFDDFIMGMYPLGGPYA